MKKSFIYTFVALALATGCTEIQETPAGPQLPEGMREFIEVSVPETKVALGDEAAGQFGMIWSAGDQVAVIDGSRTSIYELYEGAGTSSARFRYVSGDANPAVIMDVVYPATADKEVPTVQTYTSGTFDPEASRLAYHNETGKENSPIVLKNQCSYLCFQLTGKDKIRGIEVAVKDGKTYTMDLPQIQLDANPQSFYMVIPAQENVRADVIFTSAEGSMTKILAKKSFAAGKMHRFAKLSYKADKTYRILSYNIGECSKTPGVSSTKFTANIIRELQPDAVVMNEVKHTVFTAQDKTIAEDLGWKWFHQNAISTMGNTIVYNPQRLSGTAGAVLQLENRLNDAKYNETRVCHFVEFEDFILAATHLEKDDFAGHSELITQKVKELYTGTDKPVILCGDMNTRPYPDVSKGIAYNGIRTFEKDWTLLSREDQATLYNPDLQTSLICIDYIFAWKGGAPVQVLKAEVCKKVNCGDILKASDHFPIYVDLKIGNSSLPLMDETPDMGAFDVIEDLW